jgi:hypothetical protein
MEDDTNKIIYIFTTRCGIYISRTIQFLLLLNNKHSEIVFNININKNNLFIILFPHKVKIFPKNYICYQLEQKDISKWINYKYLLAILNSKLTWDYSVSNINKFDETIKKKIKLFKIPLISYYYFKPEIYNKYITNDNETNNNEKNDNITCNNEIYDVLFFGHMNQRRYKIINYIIKKLNNKFKFHYITGLYGDALFEKILQSKIVLNIHYYEGSILETCRINEILSCNKLVISELPDISDIDNKNYYNDLIIYYENIDDLIDKITFYLENKETYDLKINNNKKFIDNNLEQYKKEIIEYIKID